MFRVPEKYRDNSLPGLGSNASYGNNGVFRFWGFDGKNHNRKAAMIRAIASDGFGWEHVSITLERRKITPSWRHMCFVKELFWDDEDTVVQYHPPKSDYVNCHPYCLHLWRPTDSEQLRRPPKILVGPP